MSKTVLSYLLDKPQNFRENNWPVYYGKCEESPNIEDNLWFVSLDKYFWEKIMDMGWDKPFPFEDHTFLVEEKYIAPFYMNQFRTDVLKWSEVAKKIFVGQWCVRYEILWKDVPVYQQSELNIKYGYCHGQSSKYPDRELWYVALANGSTFVVDKNCTTDEFMKRMGNDIQKWMSICWCHLRDEVEWSKLKTGTLDGGFVRDREFGLDSPFIPKTIDDIEVTIANYEKTKKQ
jgi:hypothetical protein